MEIKKIEGYEFVLIDSSPFSSLYYNEKLMLAICIAYVDYIRHYIS